MYFLRVASVIARSSSICKLRVSSSNCMRSSGPLSDRSSCDCWQKHHSQSLAPHLNLYTYIIYFNKLSSIMGCGDSWPTIVPSVVPTGDCSHWSIQSDGRFWIGKPSFLLEIPSNHTSILQSFGDICMWQTDRQMDNADHYYYITLHSNF